MSIDHHEQPWEGCNSQPRDDVTRAALSRRDFLKVGAAGVAAITTGVMAGGCGSGRPASAPVSTQPRRGGTLRAGLLGSAGGADTLDADNGLTDVDFCRIIALHDPLVNISLQGGTELQLAESIEPNADATAWTIRLRPDITFHNGKNLTAQDLIFTFRRILNPKSPLAAASSLASLDVANSRVLDKLTVRIPCSAPFSTLVENLADYDVYVVPTGYNPKKPVGTGPFVYKSFTPGVQSVFTRNESYWRNGEPNLDELVIINFTDSTAQLNALQSRQLDYIDQLTAGDISEVQSSGNVVVTSGGAAFNNIVMRVDEPPFDDSRVRLAMKYIVDRPQMRELIFGGHGSLGNDIPAIVDPQYDHSIPQREQDLDRAKSLLKAAGHEALHLQLTTSRIGAGVVEQAQIFAQQASQAGVTVNIMTVTSEDFFGPNYLKRVFTQDAWLYGLYFAQVALSTVPNAPYNETHFNDPRYNALFAEALRTLDPVKQTQIAHEMQMIEYGQGGNIISNFNAIFDAHRPDLHGIVGSNVGLPTWAYCFRTCWLA